MSEDTSDCTCGHYREVQLAYNVATHDILYRPGACIYTISSNEAIKENNVNSDNNYKCHELCIYNIETKDFTEFVDIN